MPKRVFIVKEGHWGSVEPKEYLEQIEIFKEVIESAEDSLGKKLAQVTIIETAKEAQEKVTGSDAVIFISRGMERVAEKMASENPRVRVVVFTGLIPKGKVIWFDKGWFDRKAIQNVVLL